MIKKNRKRILVVGNWKMHPLTSKEALAHISKISMFARATSGVESVICVPDIYIPLLKRQSGSLRIGAQDASFEKEGAYTGEVSPWMLKSLGVFYVIIGHSERRALGETNELISRKIAAALKAGLTPILCVGEHERDRSDEYLRIVRDQLHECLAKIPKSSIGNIVIAYEPIWALSSTADRRDATPEDSHEMAIYIRRVVADMFKHVATVKDLRIIYGGSVNVKNIESFLRAGGIDGVLPGRESLSPERFGKMLHLTSALQ